MVEVLFADRRQLKDMLGFATDVRVASMGLDENVRVGGCSTKHDRL